MVAHYFTDNGKSNDTLDCGGDRSVNVASNNDTLVGSSGQMAFINQPLGAWARGCK